ncbi:uncharacterized protein N7458_007679 [Penicillium daleae]|uniref:Major facilitator superfamily (MFS) profile domain-containing protein n=1 Tax=Penicillium daleae TaxID=63821 RepID=A0AAD6C0Z8_9EURO|nr:uncharacterized protein N7458_007679 [Penicillium daleae]KAJ5443807.1 hypothetical protein N7458_007679 [Penicillium daleae]
MTRKFWERMSGAQLIFMVNFIVAWGIFFEGWNQGSMGFVNSTPTSNIVAIYYLGATIGGLRGGHVADQYGRVKAVILGVLFVLLSGSLIAVAENIA